MNTNQLGAAMPAPIDPFEFMHPVTFTEEDFKTLRDARTLCVYLRRFAKDHPLWNGAFTDSIVERSVTVENSLVDICYKVSQASITDVEV